MQFNNRLKIKQILTYVQHEANTYISWSIDHSDHNTYFRMRLGDLMGEKLLEGSKVCCHQY